MKKFNVLALLIFLGAAFAVFWFMDASLRQTVQDRVLGIFSPFIHSSVVSSDMIQRASQPTPSTEDMRSRNQALDIEVQRLSVIAQRVNRLVEENNTLREALGFQKNSSYNLTAARVIKRTYSNWSHTLVIDKGTLDHIGTDCPVITPQGLVGKTGKLAARVAEVIPLTDELCRVSAQVEGTSEMGILSGERTGVELNPQLKLRFLSKDAKIEIGARVLSTGEGGVFPANLFLGKVVKFENRDISGEAHVHPGVDFANLDYVFVMQMQDIQP